MNLYEKWGLFIDYYPFLAPFIFVGTIVICHSLYKAGGMYASRKLRKPHRTH